jgi:uroporphyrinogen-III synthase
MSLKHSKILVTRPEPQNQALLLKLQQLGATPIALPLIKIVTIPQADTRHDVLKNLQKSAYHAVIFLSQNAVRAAPALWPVLEPETVIAIGPGTASVLPFTPQIASAPYNSEALLKCARLKTLTGKRVLLVKGHGGRQFLAQHLTRRGAEVDELLVYRREAIDYPALTSAELEFDCAIVSSQEILMQLYHLMVQQYKRGDILQRALVVCGQRQAEHAKKLNFSQCIIAQSAADDVIIKQLLNWKETQNDRK